MKKYLLGFIVGLSIGLGVAWISIFVAISEWEEIRLAEEKSSYIDNGLAFLARDDHQMRCGLAKFVQSDYAYLKNSYPLESMWIIPDSVPRTTNLLVKIGIEQYEQSNLNEFIKECPQFKYDCSDKKTNLDHFMCSK